MGLDPWIGKLHDWTHASTEDETLLKRPIYKSPSSRPLLYPRVVRYLFLVNMLTVLTTYMDAASGPLASHQQRIARMGNGAHDGVMNPTLVALSP